MWDNDIVRVLKERRRVIKKVLDIDNMKENRQEVCNKFGYKYMCRSFNHGCNTCWHILQYFVQNENFKNDYQCPPKS